LLESRLNNHDWFTITTRDQDYASRLHYLLVSPRH
jgi:hypothetical protein